MPVNPLNPSQRFITNDVVRLEISSPVLNTDGLRNYVPNPSADLGAWSWWTAAASTLVDTAVVGADTGLRVLQYVGAVDTYALTSLMPVKTGDNLSARFKLLSVSAGRNVKVRFAYYDVDRTLLSTSVVSGAYTTTGTTNYYTAGPIGAGTIKYAALFFSLYNGATGKPSANEAFVIRDVMMTKSAAAIPATYGYVDPYAWSNITANATSIKINRAALNAGTLTALTTDATLDPAVSPATLARGNRIRVSSYVDDFTSWEALFTGTIDRAVTGYVLHPSTGTYRPQITITASEATSDLANYPIPDGYSASQGLANAFGKISSLAAGAGVAVPWLLDGAGGGFGYNLAPESTNSRASLLDQIAVTRDSLGMGGASGGPGGHAWVARDGVLNLWANPPGTVTTTYLNDASFFTLNASSTGISTSNPHGDTETVYRLTATTGGNMAAWQSVAVKAGQVVNLSGWAKAVSGTARNVRLSVTFYDRFYNAVVSTVSNVATVTGVGTAWAQVAGQVTVPIAARWAEVYLYVDSAASAQSFYVDELVIDPVFVTYSNTTTATATTVTTDCYTDVKVDYVTEQCINSVKVIYLRAVAGAESVQVPYGPYEDLNSIDVNGRQSTTLTLTGTETGARIRGTARALLAANSDPERTAESITVPVLGRNARLHATLTDLCDRVEVIYTGLVDTTPRVATIEHVITPFSWVVTYGFEPHATLAGPQVIPSPV